MLLVATSDEKYWRKDQEVLFMGDWCRLRNRESIWSKLPYRTLAYHWDDRSRLQADFAYAKEISARCLTELTRVLNDFHGCALPERYWAIVLGNWLIDFISTCLDRYLSIEAAAATGSVTDMLVPPPTLCAYVPESLAESYDLYLTSDFNNFLCGYIVRWLRPFPYHEIDCLAEPTPLAPHGLAYRVRNQIKACWRLAYRVAPDAAKRVVLVDTYFRHKDLFRLCVRLKQLPALVEKPEIPEAFNEAARQRLKFQVGSKPFERLLQELIPLQLPRSFVEGFAGLVKRADKIYPQRPRVIFTANAHFNNDLFKVWAARQAILGRRLLVNQHGGSYGSAGFSATEDYEVSVVDRFYSWGWTEKKSLKVHPMPAAKLCSAARRFKPRADGNILVCGDSVPLYFYRFSAMPIAHQIGSVNREIIEFFKKLEPEVYRLALLRLYPVDYGWQEKSLFEGALPGLKIYQGYDGFFEQIVESRLFVATSNQTTYLETMAADFPTVIFWNPAYSEIRSDAQPMFDLLRKVGIYHSSPEAAAAHVSQIAQDPQIWWTQPEVRLAREAFCQQFARTSNDWLDRWEQELKSQLFSRELAPRNPSLPALNPD